MNIIEVLKDRIQGKAPKGARRSSKWSTVRRQFLVENPTCLVCGSKKNVEAHHIIPFHIMPDRELDMENLMNLCETKKYGLNCHLLIGHLGNYSRVNPTCELDAITWKLKIKGNQK